MIKVIFGVCWGAIAVFGIYSFVKKAPRVQKQAEWTYNGGHLLEKNYRLGDADLPQISGGKCSECKGQYLRTRLSPNQTFTLANLSPGPELSVRENQIPLIWPLKSVVTSQSLNAGMRVSVWHLNRRIAADIPVLALLCPRAGSPIGDCQVILEIGPDISFPSPDKGDVILLPVSSAPEKDRCKEEKTL